MLFADWFGDAVLFVIVLGCIVCWAIGRIMKSAGDVLKSEEFQDGVRQGLWLWWLTSDDDD